MAKVNLSKEEVEQVLIALANVITIKHRYRDVYLNNSRLNIEMIRNVLHKLENPLIEDLRDKEILRGLEDMQSRTGSCESCDD